jgi:hypothetical protein
LERRGCAHYPKLLARSSEPRPLAEILDELLGGGLTMTSETHEVVVELTLLREEVRS